MTRWLVVLRVVVLLGLVLGGCEKGERTGELTVLIQYYGDGGAPDVEVEGEIVLRTSNSEERIVFRDQLRDLVRSGSVGLRIGPDAGAPSSTYASYSIRDGIQCDPDGGPVEVQVVFTAMTPTHFGMGVLPLVGASRTAEATCTSGWETGVSVGFEFMDPESVGELRVRVVLDEPPLDAVEASVGVLVIPAEHEVDVERDHLRYSAVTLLPEYGKLTGEWTSLCEGGWTRDVGVDVGSLTVPGLTVGEVWERWLPPSTARARIECVPGKVTEVELVLAPRHR